MDVSALSDLTLPATDGGEHRLGDYWAHAPAIVIFLRHFG
jgi:hypothetical protein